MCKICRIIFAANILKPYLPKDLSQLIGDVTLVLLMRELMILFYICIKQHSFKTCNQQSAWLVKLLTLRNRRFCNFIGDVSLSPASGVRWRNTFHSSESGGGGTNRRFKFTQIKNVNWLKYRLSWIIGGGGGGRG